MTDRFDDLKDYLKERFDSVDDRIDGTNERLDRLNGKVYHHAQQIAELQGMKKAHTRTKRTLTWGSAFAAITGLVEIARHFLTGKP